MLIERRGDQPDLRRRRHRGQAPPVDDRVLAARRTPRSRSGRSRTPSRCRGVCAGIIALGIRGQREHREIEQLRCERGAAIARKAGFDDERRRRHPRPARALGRGRRPARPAGRRDPPAGPHPRGVPGPRHLPHDAGPRTGDRGHDRTGRDLVRPRHRRGPARCLRRRPPRGTRRARPHRSHDGARTRRPRPDLGRRRRRPDRPGVRRHRRRQEPVHRHALVARRRCRRGSGRATRPAGARGRQRPPGRPAPRPRQARRPEHGARQAGPPRRVRDGGHPPPSGADAAHPRHDPDVRGRRGAGRLPPRAARRDGLLPRA